MLKIDRIEPYSHLGSSFSGSLLRNNNRVERLYHDIAKQAFDFCSTYSRKTEFRKLCDNVRIL